MSLSRTVLIKPCSDLCDLRCDYCFYCDETRHREKGFRGIMSPETAEQMVQKVLEGCTSCTFGFQGGEPTLAGLDYYRRIVELQTGLAAPGTQILNTIQTNGFGLDREWAAFFAEQGFLVGISLDGISSTHDLHRKTPDGSGSFNRVMESIALLKEAGADFNILTVVHAGLCGRLREVYGFYREQGFGYLQFIPCMEPLDERTGDRGNALTPEQYGRFLCELFDLWYADLLEDRQPYIRMFENCIAMLCGMKPESCDMQGVCSNQLVVEADGDVYPCDFFALDEYCLGNLNRNSLAELEQRYAELGISRRSVLLPQDCRSCPAFAICRGGCWRFRCPETSQGPLRYRYCESLKQFFYYAGPRMRAIAEVISADLRR